MATDKMSGLEWLRATIEGDKARAQAAGSGAWSAMDGMGDSRGWWVDTVWDEPLGFFTEREDWAHHVATHDPRDTIVRCEAELAILDEHAPDDPSDEEPYCRVCWSQRSDFIECDVPDLWPCRTVRLLASGYKHRPGYEDRWKPEP